MPSVKILLKHSSNSDVKLPWQEIALRSVAVFRWALVTHARTPWLLEMETEQQQKTLEESYHPKDLKAQTYPTNWKSQKSFFLTYFEVKGYIRHLFANFPSKTFVKQKKIRGKGLKEQAVCGFNPILELGGWNKDLWDVCFRKYVEKMIQFWVVSNYLCFITPKIGEMIQLWRAYFSNGLKPGPRPRIWLGHIFHILLGFTPQAGLLSWRINGLGWDSLLNT